MVTFAPSNCAGTSFCVYYQRLSYAALNSIIHDPIAADVHQIKVGARTVWAAETGHSADPSLLAWHEQGRTYMVAQRYVLLSQAIGNLTALVKTLQPLSSPPPCPPVEILGVRGSGETATDHGGYGQTVQSVVDWAQVIDRSVDADPIQYQAVGIDFSHPKKYVESEYNDSVGTGITALRAQISAFLQACHTSKLDLVGLSQGAQVVGDTYLGWLSAAERARVDHIALLGDPKFWRGQPGPVNIGSDDHNGIAAQTTKPHQFPSADYGKVRSYCQHGDPICNFSPGNAASCIAAGALCVHTRYAENNLAPGTSYTLNAARFLLSDVTVACQPNQQHATYNGHTYTVDSLTVQAIDCAHALTVAAEAEAQLKFAGWSCTKTAAGQVGCRDGYQHLTYTIPH